MDWTGLATYSSAISYDTETTRQCACHGSGGRDTGRRCFKCAACGHTSGTELTAGNYSGLSRLPSKGSVRRQRLPYEAPLEVGSNSQLSRVRCSDTLSIHLESQNDAENRASSESE